MSKDTDASRAPSNPYAVPLQDLVDEVRVPADELVEVQSENSSSAWAWNEERRQTQLAGGA